MGFDFENFYANQRERNIHEIKIKWEELDNYLFKNRNIKKYKVVKFKERKLITKIGVISFKRRIYKYYNITHKKWMYIALLDDHLQLQKWKHISSDVVDHIINSLGDGKRYKDIIDTLPNCRISKMSISRITNNSFLNIESNQQIKLKHKAIIYVNIDDSFLNLKNSNGFKQKYRFRIITFNTGFSDKNKTRLENKRVTYMYSSTEKIKPQEVTNFIYYQLKKYYCYSNQKIVICGDGAPWIKNIANNMNSDYLIDKWHPLKRLANEFLKKRNVKNLNRYYIAKDLFFKGQWEELNNYLVQEHVSYETRIYFYNNRVGVANQSKTWSFGVSAESDVYHFIKSISRGAKIYNFNSFSNMVNYRIATFNSEKISYFWH